MLTEQTLRRRRGRAIRKARRAARVRQLAPLTLTRFIEGGLLPAFDALAQAFAAMGQTAYVAAQRLMPLLFTPRDGAGARRQLLDHGRGPSKGGR